MVGGHFDISNGVQTHVPRQAVSGVPTVILLRLPLVGGTLYYFAAPKRELENKKVYSLNSVKDPI